VRDTGRSGADLRIRQIRKALAELQREHLVRLGQQSNGRRDFTQVQLLSEASTADNQLPYTVPPHERGLFLSRHFFTNMWIFALSNTEIATYLLLSFLRRRYMNSHAGRRVPHRGWVDRAASVTTALGVTFNIISARRNVGSVKDLGCDQHQHRTRRRVAQGGAGRATRSGTGQWRHVGPRLPRTEFDRARCRHRGPPC
jgi:hypothetical protein